MDHDLLDGLQLLLLELQGVMGGDMTGSGEIGGPHLRVDEVVFGDTVSVVHCVRPPHHEVGAEGTVGAPGAETTATSGGPESNR